MEDEIYEQEHTEEISVQASEQEHGDEISVQEHEHHHVVEVHCEFSNYKTSSEDTQERARAMKKLFIAVLLYVIFIIVEVVGGIKANSLAILTDATHLASDVLAFAISLFSLWASGWAANPRHSYGFFRIEVLGTLVSVMIIWFLAVILVYEACERFKKNNGEVKGFLMFIVSIVGLLFNIAMTYFFGHDHGHGHNHDDHDHHHGHGHERKSIKQKKHKNLNIQGAYLHVVGDLIQSIGVVIGAGVIWYKPKWKIIDVICTLFFSFIALCTTINTLRNIVDVLMESTPREIDAVKLEKGVCDMEEVVAIHHLHIWAITIGKIILTCHVQITPESDANMVLNKIIDYLKREFNISHITIQIKN